MSAPIRGEILRAPLFHTPRNPFHDSGALVSHADGGLLIEGGRIAGCGDYQQVRAEHPNAPTTDLRGGFLLPGFIDTHIHFPQLRVIGGLGHQLLDWLDQVALPEEARMADRAYACTTAQGFLHALASHGTTTALVFGAHFASACEALLEAAGAAGLRIVAGMVLSDRLLRPELLQNPKTAYKESTALIRRYHGKGRLQYAVTPRFALSASEPILEVCQTLLSEHEDLCFTTHINENRLEIAEVARLFPWAADYLQVYERYKLTRPRAVMAHNVHSSDSELERLAASGAAVAHCPCSNAALASGFFALQRHVEAGVTCALGTDVGGGTGFGILKEGLQAYLLQRLAPQPMMLDSAQLLYLATRAGAEALGMENQIGDFSVGKSADIVYMRPPEGSPLAAVVEHADNMDRILAGLFTLGDAHSIQEVRVEGEVVHRKRDEHKSETCLAEQ